MTEKNSMIGSPPAGYNTVVPYLVVHRAHELIDFLRKAFGAEERMRFNSEDGGISYAELSLGNSVIMLCEANTSNAATPTNINLYVNDTDAVYQSALKAGASSVSEPADQPYGERTGIVKDGAGNRWWISTQQEDLTPDEIKKRVDDSLRR